MNKYELICRKLALKPGMRLLDVGCGWGGMVRYAAENYGVTAVGVTLSSNQAEYAIEAAKRARLDDRVEIRVQDYRDITDGPFDAISSIGMFEHVGLAKLGEYFGQLRGLVRPEGRVLNHGISRTARGRKTMGRRSFINRYVFPDGQLHEVGNVVSRMQQSGFEVRHVESLREHYALTLPRVGREPPIAMGGSAAVDQPRSRARLAAVHGGVGRQLRGRPLAGASSARGARRPSTFGHAAPARLGYERAELAGWHAGDGSAHRVTAYDAPCPRARHARSSSRRDPGLRRRLRGGAAGALSPSARVQ